jgi:hypothetical protein
VNWREEIKNRKNRFRDSPCCLSHDDPFIRPPADT